MKVAGRSTRRVAVPQPPMGHVSAGGLAWRPEYSCPSFPLSTLPRLIQTALGWVGGAPWGVPRIGRHPRGRRRRRWPPMRLHRPRSLLFCHPPRSTGRTFRRPP